jgi:hypothetical protein
LRRNSHPALIQQAQLAINTIANKTHHAGKTASAAGCLAPTNGHIQAGNGGHPVAALMNNGLHEELLRASLAPQ